MNNLAYQLLKFLTGIRTIERFNQRPNLGVFTAEIKPLNAREVGLIGMIYYGAWVWAIFWRAALAGSITELRRVGPATFGYFGISEGRKVPTSSTPSIRGGICRKIGKTRKFYVDLCRTVQRYALVRNLLPSEPPKQPKHQPS